MNAWKCWRSGSGGGTLELAAVLCPGTDVACGDIPSSGGGTVTDDPLLCLRTCLWLRDEGYIGDDEKPPYAALLGVAEFMDLDLPEEDRLQHRWEFCRDMFDKMSLPLDE